MGERETNFFSLQTNPESFSKPDGELLAKITTACLETIFQKRTSIVTTPTTQHNL